MWPFNIFTLHPDHDLRVMKKTSTSSRWSHVRACTECHSPVGHQEFMTQICLSCGQEMSQLPFDAAMRKIVRNGKWTQTIRVKNVEYEKVDGEWKPIS